VVGQHAVGAFAQPGGEAALLGDRGQRVVTVVGAEGEFLTTRLPAEFFNEEFPQIAALEQWSGTGEYEWHGSESTYGSMISTAIPVNRSSRWSLVKKTSHFATLAAARWIESGVLKPY